MVAIRTEPLEESESAMRHCKQCAGDFSDTDQHWIRFGVHNAASRHRNCPATWERKLAQHREAAGITPIEQTEPPALAVVREATAHIRDLTPLPSKTAVPLDVLRKRLRDLLGVGAHEDIDRLAYEALLRERGIDMEVEYRVKVLSKLLNGLNAAQRQAVIDQLGSK